MNNRFLYAATVAASLLSVGTLAFADEAPVSRAQVNAELRQAIANGTLKRTDADFDLPRAAVDTSTTTRAQVNAEWARDRAERSTLVGDNANRDFNPAGTAIYATSTLARSEVKAEVLQAAADGTLRRTDHDDAASMARQAKQHAAAPKFAQRLKARFKNDAS